MGTDLTRGGVRKEKAGREWGSDLGWLKTRGV